MTTIALDKDGLIAYDSRTTENNLIVDDKTNKRRDVNGTIYFICGRDADESLLIEAVEGNPQEKYSKHIDCGALVIRGGEVFTASIDHGEGFVWQRERFGNCVALGSGSKHALTAMDLGCNAREAVKMAAKRDNYTGGRIRTYKCEPPE